MEGAVRIDYFSDVLCVWAYVSQVRLDEVRRHFGARVDVHHHFVPVFGAAPDRVARLWKARGGSEGYADHVGEVCAQFEHVQLNPNAWRTFLPLTSANAHLYASAVRVLCEEGLVPRGPTDQAASLDQLLWEMRLAFFRDNQDISDLAVLDEIANRRGLPVPEIRRRIESGSAMAKLCRDLELRDELKVEGSPTYVLNEGRQKLYGNVGYRIIEANIEEIFGRPAEGASWC